MDHDSIPDDDDVASALDSPRAQMFGGRRRSDRWIAYLLVILIALTGLSTAYMLYRQRVADQRLVDQAAQHEALLVEVREQNQAVLCLNANTTSADIAAINYLLTQPANGVDPAIVEAIEQLKLARERLRAAGAPPLPSCPGAPTTTTTTR